MASMWRVCYSLLTLRAEVNARWPGRSKVSDGTIGDLAHQSRTSDHNAWVKDAAGIGVVRALDITAAGIDCDAYAEHLRALGEGGDPRLNNGGYIIWNRRIASETGNWRWRAYSGSNPHTRHAHVSVSRSVWGFDSRAPWGVTQLGLASPLPPRDEAQASRDADRELDRPVLKVGDSGEDVRRVQRDLIFLGFDYVGKPDGDYGPLTQRAVRDVQWSAGLHVDGVYGPNTQNAMGLTGGSQRGGKFPGNSLEGSVFNNATRAYQARLKARGWPVGVDGYHGPRTSDILRQFHRQCGMGDHRSIADRGTWIALWARPVT